MQGGYDNAARLKSMRSWPKTAWDQSVSPPSYVQTKRLSLRMAEPERRENDQLSIRAVSLAV